MADGGGLKKQNGTTHNESESKLRGMITTVRVSEKEFIHNESARRKQENGEILMGLTDATRACVCVCESVCVSYCVLVNVCACVGVLRHRMECYTGMLCTNAQRNTKET